MKTADLEAHTSAEPAEQLLPLEKSTTIVLRDTPSRRQRQRSMGGVAGRFYDFARNGVYLVDEQGVASFIPTSAQLN